jgi:outer membrane protein OmpA-like peptidoglycan-associated protein
MMTRRLSGYPHRTLIVWMLAFTVGWLAFCSPWSAGWNVTIGVFAVLVGITALVVATRRQQARRSQTQQVLIHIEETLSSLPCGLKRNTPLILAAGDANTLQAAFGEDIVRLTDAAIWVRTAQPSQLMHLADALKYWRDGQGPEAIAYLMNANDGNQQASLSATLQAWRSAIHEASRALGYRLPACTAVYLQDAALPPTHDGIWFGITGGSTLAIELLPACMASKLMQSLQFMPSGDEANAPSSRRAARLDALTQWASLVALPVLTDPQRNTAEVRLCAFGVTAVTGVTAPQSLFAGFTAVKTGLRPSGITSSPVSTFWPLPEPLLRGIPAQAARPALPRAMAHALIWLAFFFCAAAAASAWQNRVLVQRLFTHIQRYETTLSTQDAARVDALGTLKQDRNELEQYARGGIPLRLGMGFYQGKTWLPRINALIADYQPPSPPPATIELNSMSLFKSGSAILNPGSNRVLVRALELIKAHADKRVLIAGHTDTTGDARSNQKLSEARAASVRDWLSDASGIPPSRFAIQGYGDTRPKIANDTEAGRAANRRVEITLVTDCRNQRNTPGQTACSFN